MSSRWIVAKQRNCGQTFALRTRSASIPAAWLASSNKSSALAKPRSTRAMASRAPAGTWRHSPEGGLMGIG